MKEKLKILELFGGIGACSKALERLNIEHEVVDYVEIDKYAVKSYNAIHNTNFEPQDITTWNKQLDVDLIMHGSPCQDFSLAGKQAGGDKDSGTRSSLLYETVRIVSKLKPKYVIWENVKNVLSQKHRHNFDNYLSEMEELGYTNYYQVLNAKDYGIPQNRERVFTISILGEHETFTFPPKQELKLRLKDMLEDEVDEKYYLSDKMISYVLSSGTKNFYYKPEIDLEIARPLSTDQNKRAGTTNYFSENYLKNDEKLLIKEATKKGYKEAYDGDSVNIAYPESETRRGRVGEQVAQTLQCNDNMGVVESYVSKKYSEFKKEKGYVPELFNPYNQKEITNIAPTQSTQCGSTTSSATVLIKENTKKGYAEAHDGDGVYINRPHQKRGVVQKQMIQTIKCSADIGVVVKNQGKEIVRETDISTTLLARDYKEFGNQEMTGVVEYSEYSKKKIEENIKAINNELSGTLTANCMQSINHDNCQMIRDNLRIRKLTPLETWRLMGFDDIDFKKAEEVNSNAQLYKQAGNSIVVNVLEEIFKELFKEDQQ